MILEKVYDELYGMIEDLKKKVAAMSGGTEVTITPAFNAGIKLADFTIDDVSGAINMPELEYSTTEKKIGKWVDGSDYYQRVFVGESVSSNSSTIQTFVNFPLNLDVKEMSGVLIDGSLVIPFGVYNENTYKTHMWIQPITETNRVVGRFCWGTDSAIPVIILRYTKQSEAETTKKTTKKK